MAVGTVILVPGFLGSQLLNPIAPIGPSSIWLDPAALATGGFNRLALAVPSEDIPAPWGPPPRPGYPLPAYYGLLQAFLLARGWRVVSPRADWRLPIAHDGALLADLIRDEGAATPVRILCHSRGGLVTRYALGLLAATQESALVSRVVGMGVPHTGSLLAAALLGGWHNLIEQIASVGTYVPSFVADLIGVSRVRSTARTWPAVYQLLPPPGAPWATTFDPAALYLPSTWALSSLRPVSAHLSAALAAWSALPAVPGSLDWIDVVGTGIDTPFSIPRLSRINERGAFGYTLAGDGVVPVASARQLGRRVIATPTQHDLLPNDGRLWPWLDFALRNGLAADLTLEGRILSL